MVKVRPPTNIHSPTTFDPNSIISCSDSEGEELTVQPPKGKAKPKPPSGPAPQVQGARKEEEEDLEVSRTKYLPPESGSGSDSDSESEEPTLKPPKLGSGKYVDLDLPQASGRGGAKSDKATKKQPTYAQIKPHVKFASAPSTC